MFGIAPTDRLRLEISVSVLPEHRNVFIVLQQILDIQIISEVADSLVVCQVEMDW